MAGRQRACPKRARVPDDDTFVRIAIGKASRDGLGVFEVVESTLLKAAAEHRDCAPILRAAYAI